jgi:hypothetical protein
MAVHLGLALQARNLSLARDLLSGCSPRQSVPISILAAKTVA